MDFLKELFLFLRTGKKYWLFPLVAILLVLAALIVVTGASALGPLLYSLF